MSRRARKWRAARDAKHAEFYAGEPADELEDDASAEPEHCACFPGCCRGGQVVDGRLANGQRCKASITAGA